MARFVTLINRSSKTLNGVWDGRHYPIAPGMHQFPEHLAAKFKEQNPIMGTEDPYNLQMNYLIGIVEHEDPTTPIEQSSAAERWDRAKMPGPGVDIVSGKNGIFAEERHSNLAVGGGVADSSFVKA